MRKLGNGLIIFIMACLAFSLFSCRSMTGENYSAKNYKKNSSKGVSLKELDARPLTPEQMDGGLATVTSVEFGPLAQKNRSRLSIRTDKLVKAKINSQNDGKTIFLTFSPALIEPEQIKSIAKSVVYGSSITGLTCVNKENKVVELKINLQKEVPYQLGQKGLATYLDFDNIIVANEKGNNNVATEATAVPVMAAIGSAGLSFAPAVSSVASSELATASLAAGNTSFVQGVPSNPPAGTLESGNAVTDSYNVNPGRPKNYTGEVISLDFQGADIHNILRLIGEVSGKNIVIPEKVQGKVTLKLDNVPWDQALDIVLRTNNLGFVQTGNVIRIDDLNILKREQQDQFDEVSSVQKVRENAPLLRAVFSPKYAQVELMKNSLEKVKTSRGSLNVIGNDIHAEDVADALQLMRTIFSRNDQVTRQVLIEGRIVEVNSSFERSVGMSWTSKGTTRGTLGPIGSSVGSGSMIPGSVESIGSGAGSLILDSFILNKSNTLLLGARLSASESVGDTKVISAPRIMAADRQNVSIKQSTQIPYRTVDRDGAKIEFQEAKLELEVTPFIEQNGQIITLNINLVKETPTITRFGATLGGEDDKTEDTGAMAIDSKEAKTSLMIKDGETVVIGGIIVDTVNNTEARVPVIHKIPILGWLFKSRVIEDDKKELLIFITANIIPVTI